MERLLQQTHLCFLRIISSIFYFVFCCMLLYSSMSEFCIRGWVCNPYKSWAKLKILIILKLSFWTHILNELTIKNKYFLPWTYDLFDYVYGAKVFSNVDLDHGYHQMQVKETNLKNTTFWLQLGHYEYVVMPFGLTKSSTTCMTLMNSLFCEHLDKFVLV